MTIGHKVKLIGIPPDLNNDAELRSRELFEKCLGRTFTETVEGLPYQLVQLDARTWEGFLSRHNLG